MVNRDRSSGPAFIDALERRVLFDAVASAGGDEFPAWVNDSPQAVTAEADPTSAVGDPGSGEGRGLLVETMSGGCGCGCGSGPGAVLGLDGKLTVTGSDNRDNISIYRQGDHVVVSIDGAAQNFPAGNVAGIEVNAGDGNDDVANSTDKKSTLNGGAGNDWLYGGSNDDTINGGDDNDHCYGRGGNDKVNGGAGTDNCHGGDGNDTIDGGTGADVMNGDGDHDQFINLLDGSNDTCSGGDGTDTGAGNGVMDPGDSHDGTVENWGGGIA